MLNILRIRTLGKFSVSIGDVVISDSSSRSQKVWKIFKYILTNRHKMVPVDTLIDVVWPNGGPDNPQKSLFTLMSRLRKILADNGAQGQYILFRHDSYQWNQKLPYYLDAAEFEQLISSSRVVACDEEKMTLLKKATEIYVGEYLSELAYEPWGQPVNNYYKRLYLSAVCQLSDIYARASMHDGSILLCSKAIKNEPYEESLYERLIRSLIINGEIAEAKKRYRYFYELMQNEFGAEPSEELRMLYQEIQEEEGEELDLTAIRQRLDKGTIQSGVYFCTLDVFNQIYLFDKRSDERMNFPVFLGLVTLTCEGGGFLEDSLLKSAMSALQRCIMSLLRRGDVVSRYSKNQYLLMLSAFRQEDAETAMKRVESRFEKENAGSPFKLTCSVMQAGKQKEL